MSGTINNPTSSWDRAVLSFNTAMVWGSAFISGASSAYAVSRSSMAIAMAINSLPRSTAFDPLVYTLGVPSLFGLIGAMSIPIHCYNCYSVVTSTEVWRTKGIALIKNLGSLGMAIGATVQTVIFIWNEAQPHLGWLPGFQLISTTIAGSDVVLSGIHLHRLKRLDEYLNNIDKLPTFRANSRKKIFTEESAEKFLGVPKSRFKEFSEALAKEPEQGLNVLRTRVKEKIVEQRLRVVAGVISLLALGILLGLAFAPTPLAPVVLTALTIVAYFFSGTSSILSVLTIWKNVNLLNPYFGCTNKREAAA